MWIRVCCLDHETGADAEYEATTTLGHIWEDSPPSNCESPGEFELDPVENVGVAHLVVTFSIGGVEVCEATADVNVIPEEEEEEEEEDPPEE